MADWICEGLGGDGGVMLPLGIRLLDSFTQLSEPLITLINMISLILSVPYSKIYE